MQEVSQTVINSLMFGDSELAGQLMWDWSDPVRGSEGIKSQGQREADRTGERKHEV